MTKPNAGYNELETLDPIWCAWFSGFVDGEGYFSVRHDKNRCAIVRFEIQLAEADASILSEIHTTLGCGVLGRMSRQYQRDIGRMSQDAIRYLLNHNGGIVNLLIPILDKYPLRTKKAFDYKIFREAALFQHENQTPKGRGFRTPDDIKDKFSGLVSEMKVMRASKKILPQIESN